jgi:hypothetical protein
MDPPVGDVIALTPENGPEFMAVRPGRPGFAEVATKPGTVVFN